MSKCDFKKLLIQAVDEGLSSLGESSRRAIYFHLERNFNVKKQEIPCKIEVFADAIEKIFGTGADFIELLIMKRLHEKVGGTFDLQEPADFAFVEYVTAAKRGFVEKKKIKDLSEMLAKCEEIDMET